MADDDDGVTIDPDSVPDLRASVDFVRQYGGSLRPRGNQTLRSGIHVGSRQPIRAILLQDCGKGEKALAAVLHRLPESDQVDGTRYIPGFRIDLFGYQMIGNVSFKVKLTGTNVGSSVGAVIFETDYMGASGDITAETMKQAIITANPNFTDEDFSVTIGNPYISNQFVNNSFLFAHFDYKQGGERLHSEYVGTWLLHFNRIPTQPPLNDASQISVALTVTENPVVPSNAGHIDLLLARPVFDGWDGETVEHVTDVLDLASPTPMRKGTKVVCIDFPDVGYGIISGNQREFTVLQ